MILKRCAEVYQEYSEWVIGKLERITDLAVPFRSFHVYHPSQHGRYSLKSVLPALTGKEYGELEIHDGGQAGREYLKILDGRITGADKRGTLENL